MEQPDYAVPIPDDFLSPDDLVPGASWPSFEAILDRLDRVSSPRMNRWLKAAAVRAALGWLTVSIGLAVIAHACDSMARAVRR